MREKKPSKKSRDNFTRKKSTGIVWGRKTQQRYNKYYKIEKEAT